MHLEVEWGRLAEDLRRLSKTMFGCEGARSLELVAEVSLLRFLTELLLRCYCWLRVDVAASIGVRGFESFLCLLAIGLSLLESTLYDELVSCRMPCFACLDSFPPSCFTCSLGFRLLSSLHSSSGHERLHMRMAGMRLQHPFGVVLLHPASTHAHTHAKFTSPIAPSSRLFDRRGWMTGNPKLSAVCSSSSMNSRSD